ncbi:carbohydrate-binding protein [Clostridium thermarum]|uniref:carbohydrate-binding protein n=1 Tax=Clostridium thermarum TaxID=1716543 RepID=UPI00111CE682|nr:carbohydrate-binding protein [Clostridium thermarum]
MDAVFTKNTDSISSNEPGRITFDVEAPEEGSYAVTIYAKCSPAGLYCEIRDNTGTKIGNGACGPSTEYVQTKFNVTLAAGANTLSLFCAPGAGSTVTIDKITFELE